MKKIFLLIFILTLGFSGARAEAKTVTSGDFQMDYVDPLFTVTNAVPGGIYKSNIISVTNTGSSEQDVQFAIEVKTNPVELAQKLYLSVENDSGNCLYDCDYSNSLEDLSSNKSEIHLGKIDSGETLKYYFYLKFDENAGNEFQNTSMSFDITLGYASLTTPPSSISTSSSVHHGDNDNRGGGDNGDRNKHKKKKTVPQTIAQAVRSFFQPTVAGAQGENGSGGAPGESGTGGEVKGVETSAVSGASAENCQSWPAWMWILALLIFVLVMLSDIFKNYKKTQYGWKVSLAWVALAIVFWFIFDVCRDARWFLYLVIILAIVAHFSYLSLLKKKIKKSGIN